MRIVRILLITAFLAGPTTLSAQSVSLGARAGVSVADVDLENVEDIVETDSRTGFSAGAFLELPLSELISLEPGVSFTQKGFETVSEGEDISFNLDYVEIPVLLKINVPTTGPLGLHVYGGPVVGFEATCELEALDIVVDCDDEGVSTKSTDFGAMFGGGLAIGVADGVDVVLDGFYNLGLTNVDDNEGESEEVKNRSFLFTGGLSFGLGG